MQETQKYLVGLKYTVWLEVEADSEGQAFDRAMTSTYRFEDVNHTGARLTIDPYAIASVEAVNVT